MTFTIAVRELVEFTAKTGDLDLRFTPAPTAEEGIEGHRVVAARRGAGYQAERALQAEFSALSKKVSDTFLDSLESGAGLTLRLRGRIDGYDPARRLLEEVKTYRGDITRIPDNQRELHWAQAMIYGAMLCAEDGLEEIDIALVYFDIGDQKETPVTRHFGATELQEFLTGHCTRFLRWAEQEMAHRKARDHALEALKFPYPEFRHGQRLLAEGVYRATRDGACLMAQAPTGIGKTMGTLFPLLKAMPTQQLDRIFFLTAKTPGRALALDAARRLVNAPECENTHASRSTGASSFRRSGFTSGAPSPTWAPESDAAVGINPDLRKAAPIPEGGDYSAALPLRVLELTARDKACVHPVKECHGDSCPLAKGFGIKGSDTFSVSEKVSDPFMPPAPFLGPVPCSPPLLDQPALQRLAAEHQVCPYYLAQELARWSDVIVGDYNYYFDVSALLHALTQSCEWKVAVLADEAHNLIDRAREMYSAELQSAQLAALRKIAPATLKRPLGRLQKAWDELHEGSLEDEEASGVKKVSDTFSEAEKVSDTFLTPTVSPSPHSTSQRSGEYRILDELPAAFTGALQGAIAKIADYQAEQPLEVSPELLQFYFDALHFQNLLECLGPWSPPAAPATSHPCGSDSLTEAQDSGAVVRLKPDPQDAPEPTPHSFIDLTTPPPGRGARRLRIRNVTPAPFLIPRLQALHALTLFSATLTPPELHRHLLGLPENTRWLDVPSPFAPEQLAVRLVDRISTRYRDREASLRPIAQLMAAQYEQRPGNYLAFFSSHDYLQRVLAVFRAAHPAIPVREQSREMSEAARAEFIEGFGEATQGIAFAVLGGAFGEGIDLPGERLIGAFVATLGLPQVNAQNEKIKELLQAQFGAGYDYTYLYPGLQKVVQAAGRVIRTQEDRGVVYLIDDRFTQARVRALLPAWWQPRIDAREK